MSQGINTHCPPEKMSQTAEQGFHLCLPETNLGAFFAPSKPFCDTGWSGKILFCSTVLPHLLDWNRSLDPHTPGCSGLF